MGEELRKKQDEMLKQLETLTEDNRRKVTINNNDDNDNGNNNEYVGYILGRGGREVEEGAGDGPVRSARQAETLGEGADQQSSQEEELDCVQSRKQETDLETKSKPQDGWS